LAGFSQLIDRTMLFCTVKKHYIFLDLVFGFEHQPAQNTTSDIAATPNFQMLVEGGEMISL
jgi:hypothetical protein